VPVLALILPVARSALSGLWSVSSSPIGAAIIAFGIAWFWSGHRERVACDARAEAFRADLQRVADAEHLRREAAIAEARAVGAAESEALARKNLDLEIRLKESADASHAADSLPCLDAASVLRLNRLAR
jgi:hypothetical protein